MATGILDSFTFVDLSGQCEQEFGIQISIQDVDLQHFRSISSITEFILTQ